jgi:hypothetical protein
VKERERDRDRERGREAERERETETETEREAERERETEREREREEQGEKKRDHKIKDQISLHQIASREWLVSVPVARDEDSLGLSTIKVEFPPGGERQRERDRERDRDRQRERDRERERERERERQRETERETERERQTERQRQKDREREASERETEREGMNDAYYQEVSIQLEGHSIQLAEGVGTSNRFNSHLIDQPMSGSVCRCPNMVRDPRRSRGRGRGGDNDDLLKLPLNDLSIVSEEREGEDIERRGHRRHCEDELSWVSK